MGTQGRMAVIQDLAGSVAALFEPSASEPIQRERLPIRDRASNNC